VVRCYPDAPNEVSGLVENVRGELVDVLIGAVEGPRRAVLQLEDVAPPTIHLTNWSSKGLHGPGRRWTIMARPRAWEHGDGAVTWLVPQGDEIQLMREALALRNAAKLPAALNGPMGRYQATIKARWAGNEAAMEPGQLAAWVKGEGFVAVRHGDTLLCACARGAECHRRWAAPYLRGAGWRVLLDGEECAEWPADPNYYPKM
jgi:hypothetical protein